MSGNKRRGRPRKSAAKKPSPKRRKVTNADPVRQKNKPSKNWSIGEINEIYRLVELDIHNNKQIYDLMVQTFPVMMRNSSLSQMGVHLRNARAELRRKQHDKGNITF